MSFRNPNAVTVYNTEGDINVFIQYKSVSYKRRYFNGTCSVKISTNARYYKSLNKIKQTGLINKEFLLPVFNVIHKDIQTNNFISYIVNARIYSYLADNLGLEVTYSYNYNEKRHFFESTDEFLYIIACNLNYMLTQFAKTFRRNPDSNISLTEYFDSYYNSTNFASIVKNSNGKVLR
jgi:hypothetical protein